VREAKPEIEPEYLEGIRLFREGLYFQSHEVLEDLWKRTMSPERRFYQGLIQIAVAFHHASGGNFRGAVSQGEKGRGKLEAYAPRQLDMDVDRLLADLEGFIDAWARGIHPRDPRWSWPYEGPGAPPAREEEGRGC